MRCDPKYSSVQASGMNLNLKKGKLERGREDGWEVKHKCN